MDVDAGIDEVSFARLNWQNKPAVPTDPTTMARPVGPRGVDDLVKTPDRMGDDAPGVGPQPDASMEVGGSTGSGGPPTKEDLSEFDEVDPDAHTSTGDTGVSVEGYTITPDGEYYDPDSQETFQTLEAWKAQRRSSRHRVVRASATESKDPMHGGLEEPDERNPNYYMEMTRSRREDRFPSTRRSPDPTGSYFTTSQLERKISSRLWPASLTRRGTRTR